RAPGPRAVRLHNRLRNSRTKVEASTRHLLNRVNKIVHNLTLEDISAYSGLKRLVEILFFLMLRQKNDSGFGARTRQLPRGINPVEGWHADVDYGGPAAHRLKRRKKKRGAIAILL